MATSNILGLFTSPDEYQAQQLAAEQQRALGFSQLSPMQLANYSLFLGGQQLGRGLAGVFGVQDPQLQRIRQRQEIMQTINPADPESLMAGVQRASQMGDQELALSLTDFMNKQGSEMALARQRQAQADRERTQALPAGIQEAARIREIETQLATLDPNSTEYKSLVAEKDRLQKTGRASSQTEAQKNAFDLTASEFPDLDTDSKEFKTKYSANLQKLLKKGGEGKLAELTDLFAQRKDAVATFGEDSQSVKIIDRLINSIAPEKGEKVFESTAIVNEIFDLEKQIRNNPTAPEAADLKAKADLLRLQLKRERPNLDTLGLAKGGKYDGQPVFLDENTRKTFVFDTDKTGKQIEVPYTGGLKGLKGGTEVNVGGSVVKVDTSETGKAAGKELGKELITVKDKQSAIDSIRDAISILDQGIYAGSYSAIRKGLAKYGGIGDPDKVARTEEFVSYIGDVVVARLKDFGGNDSEQELAYLNKIIGGDLEIEPKALKRILERAEAKIQRGIERLRRQAESGEKKESLTTTLPPATDGAQTPAPKPTMRYNPATKKLERIK